MILEVCECPRMSAYVHGKISPRRTLADFRGHSWTRSANVRGGQSDADIRGHSRTISCGRSRTVAADFSRGHSRTFADIPRLFSADCGVDIFGLFRGHSRTFPWTFADFFRGHSRTFSADIRGLFPRTSADFFRGHSRTFFPRTFADIDKFFLLTFEYIRILFGHLPNVSK